MFESVKRTKDFERILALPRKSQKPSTLTESLTAVLKASRGTQTLRPLQAEALWQIWATQNLFGILRVGSGKTLISFLAQRMLRSKRPLLLIPAKLQEKTFRDIDFYRRHWTFVPPKVVSYEILGRISGADILSTYSPDVIIADEMHRLKNMNVGCTRRVIRYFKTAPDTSFVGLSGTVMQRSIFDFYHLMYLALGNNTPFPEGFFELREWGYVLDEVPKYAPSSFFSVGALDVFSGGVKDRIKVREGLARFIADTPGVVVSTSRGIDASIEISAWDCEATPAIEVQLNKIRTTWVLPNEDELILAVDAWRHLREIALGYYYLWDPSPPRDWLDARREYARFVRGVLRYSRTLDTPHQVAIKHAANPVVRAWQGVKGKYTPKTVPVWFDKTIIKRAAKYENGIIWTSSQTVGHALDDLGIPYYGAQGVCARTGEYIEDTQSRTICVSIAANAEGRNLQRFYRNLVLTPPTQGLTWEQLIGRTHREGQYADCVSVEVYLGCEELVKDFARALRDAQFQGAMDGSEKKLLIADLC